MSRNPYVGSGRLIEGGALATRKQDFNAHVDGTSFRQMANTVDVSTIEGVAAANVQEALEALSNLITSAGSGFISIGLADGYAQGSYTVGTDAYPSLRDAFNGAVGDPRLANGGVILVLAGTYKTAATITIPSGITVMGEMGGTIIIGETPDLPMFLIEGTSNRITIGGDNGSGALPLDSSAKLEAVKFVNLTLIDNLDGYAAFGQTSMPTAPMVRCAINSNFTCEFVRFIGRITDNSSYQLCTAHAVRSATGSSSGTHLKFYKCFFDGINVPVYWTPAGGRLDSFVMDGCRARVFSKGESQASENCFVALTECNATVSNNQIHEGGGVTLEYGFVLTEVYNDGSTLTFTGNHGYGTSRVDKIIDCEQVNALTYNAVMSGNSWGQSIGTGWIIIAGLDFVGTGALQTILNTGLQLNETEVYLFGSTVYKVTTNGSQYLKLIGGTVSLAVSSGSDTGVSSNRQFLIRSAQGTVFKCYIADTSIFHTVVCGWGATLSTGINKIAHVDSCRFVDCGLRFLEVAAGTLENDSSQVIVSNCQFYQTDTYDPNYSLLMPSASLTILENTKISGSGYAGGIGESSTYDSNALNPFIIVRNCSLIANRGVDLNTLSPIVGTNDHYFWINDDTAKVLVENTIFNPARPGTVATNGTYSKAIYIKGLDVKVENTRFQNNDDFFVSSSIGYQLPMLYVEPLTSLAVDRCDFSNTSLALQVGGPSAFTTTPVGATITNCNFNTNSDYSTTSIDFDVDLNSIPSVLPRIKIDGNMFYHSPGDGESYPVRHTEATGSFYDTLAGVMIYANLFDVIFTNNTMHSVIETGTFTKVAGVMIDNQNSNTQSSQRVTKTVFENNAIYVESLYDAVEGMDPLEANAVSVVTPVLHMNHNTMSMYLNAALGDVQTRVLTLDVSPAQGVSEALVTGNVITTRNESGSSGFLSSEFVYIQNGSGKGRFTGNTFTDEVGDIVSGGTEEVDDNSTDGWLIYDNKNQIKSNIILSSHGTFSVVDTASLASSFNLAGYDGMGVSSRITGSTSTSSTGKIVTFNYTDTTDEIRFSWLAQGMAIIPYGVTILSVSVDYTLSASSTTRTLILTLNSAAGTDTTSITIGGTTPSTLTKTATFTHVNLPENYVRFAVSALIEDASTIDLIIDDFTVNYKW